MIPNFALIQSKFQRLQNYKNSGYLRNEKVTYGLFQKQISGSPIPLKNIDYSVKINNTLARVTISQTYVNYLSSTPIDVEYRFAISANTCFEDFEAVYDGKVIKGVVKEREEALKEFDKNIAEGKMAAVSGFSSFSKDILSISLGNMAPKKEIVIKFTYIQTLDVLMNKFLSLIIPSTLSERYGAKKEALIERKEEPLAFMSPEDPQAYPWTISISIQSPSEIIFLKSSTHQISVEFTEGRKKANITLDKSIQWLPNKDFNLLWRHEQVNLPTAILTENSLDNKMPYCALLSFFPDFYEMSLEDALAAELDKETGGLYNFGEGLNDARGEYIFLIDRSGSMSGARINMAIETLKIFIKSLPKNSYFNIISFGSSFESLFSQSKKCCQDVINNALKVVTSFQANMGGTEIFEPFKFIYKSKTIPNYPRNIFLISDGGVYNSHNIVDIVHNNRDLATVYSVGIGSGASSDLIAGVATAGKGKFEMISDNEDMSVKVISLLEHSISPFINDFNITFDKEITELMIPEKMSFIRKNQPLELFFFFNDKFISKGGKTAITLTYNDPQKNKVHSSEIVINITNLLSDENTKDKLPKLAVFRTVRSLENDILLSLNPGHGDVFFAQKQDFQKLCLEKSLKYQILSESTAFICVIEAVEIEKNMGKEKIIVPNLISNDYLNYGDDSGIKLARANKKSSGGACCGGGGGPSYSASRELNESNISSKSPSIDRKIKDYVVIAELQNIDGFWDLSNELLNKIGFVKDEYLRSIPKNLSEKQNPDRLWASALALAFLEIKFADKRDGWVLVFKKGVAWLRGQGVDLEKLLEEAKSLIKKII